MRDREYYMGLALDEARLAAVGGEVPVGCVIVRGGEVIAAAHNACEGLHTASAHAELLAINAAGRALGGWRLEGCELYVNLEPCPMCAGAIINARVPVVVYGLRDRAAGAVGGVINLFEEGFGHRPRVYGGVRAEESAALLRSFFMKMR